MVLASFFFASMAVGIKYAAHSFSTFELVFYRGLVSVCFMAVVVHMRGASLRTAVPMMHLTRSGIGVVSMAGWFFSIGQLPLATAMTLNYMSGVWVAAFIVGGALLYGDARKQGPLLLTVLVGFAGVVLALHPTLEHDQLFAGVIGLLSGICSAVAYLQVTALGKIGEPEERTVFYFSVGTTLVGAVGTFATQHVSRWADLDPRDALWVIPIGILASLGQWCMTRAYRKGATLVVASMQYSGIVFAAIFSLTLFGDQISASGWLGIVVIVASGVAATILRTRVLPNTPAEDH